MRRSQGIGTEVMTGDCNSTRWNEREQDDTGCTPSPGGPRRANPLRRPHSPSDGLHPRSGGNPPEHPPEAAREALWRSQGVLGPRGQAPGPLPTANRTYVRPEHTFDDRTPVRPEHLFAPPAHAGAGARARTQERAGAGAQGVRTRIKRPIKRLASRGASYGRMADESTPTCGSPSPDGTWRSGSRPQRPTRRWSPT